MFSKCYDNFIIQQSYYLFTKILTRIRNYIPNLTCMLTKYFDQYSFKYLQQRLEFIIIIIIYKIVQIYNIFG